jgi:RNA 2',3'-cyclic 3'-phosphodiesterase
MYRLFAAIPVPEDLWDGLDDLHDDTLIGARWRPAEAYHITLCFFGEMNFTQARDLDDLLATISAPLLTLELVGAGWFGRKAPASLHVRVAENTGLRHLASECERMARRMGLAIERGPYVPHVTLAYLVDTPLAHARAWSEQHQIYRSDTFLADQFYLYSSRANKTGRTYTEEAEYWLGQQPGGRT